MPLRVLSFVQAAVMALQSGQTTGKVVLQVAA
jgi:hypothetical protein